MSIAEKRTIIEPGLIPIMRQCELVSLSKSSYYYQPATETPENLQLMRLIDEIYTDHPYYGRRRMTAVLKALNFDVNDKRISRLMQIMGLETIYPKPNLSKASKIHTIYPYLLKGKTILCPNEVFAADITYIRMVDGFMYLVAIIDWFSRYVIAWRLSNTLDSHFCCNALEEALEIGCPHIFNTDQGSQFTSNSFTNLLNNRSIRISMTGRGRCLDNVFVERLWWSLKHEEVYLKDYRTVTEAEQGIRNYFEFYNNKRLHQSLNYKTPFDVYRGGIDALR